MKTSIKRFSKCSISVVLAVMMLVTSLTVGMVNFNAVTLSDSDSSAVSAASENDAVGANSDGSEAVGANAGNSVGAVAQFTEGEIIYLDLSAFTSWKEANATFYI